MSLENSSIPMSTTAMIPEQTTVVDHLVWIPYVAFVILFIAGLAFSFRRHHLRQLKKRQYIVEYQEKNLSVRRPRIRGKLTHFGDAECFANAPLPALTPNRASERGNDYSYCRSDPNYHPLTSDDVNCSFVSDVSPVGERNGVKKRYRSTPDVPELNLCRQISEDEYFRRKGPRDAYYLKSASERHLSPGKHKQRVYDSGSTDRSLWVRSGVGKLVDDNKRIDEAVKYIKVFDLDLCHDCRLHVERVDGTVKTNIHHAEMYRTAKEGSLTPDSHLYPYERERVNQKETSFDHRHHNNPPEVSIAEVHAPPPCGCENQFKPLSPSKHNEQNEIYLSALDAGRPRSAPNLNLGGSNWDYFKLGLQGKNAVSVSFPSLTVE